MCHERDFVFLKAFLGILSYKNIVINYYNITYRTEKDIPQNLIDGMVVSDFYIDKDNPMWLDIDCIVIWCDALKLDWSVINKVWSFWICSAAYHSKIPVYIAWNLLKCDIHNDVHIETRDPKEVWPDKPEELEIINFAFDQIPGKYITWIITEFWIIKPAELKKRKKKNYPWMAESKSREERRQ